MSPRSQARRTARVITELGDDVLLLKAMHGVERLSRPFEHRLTLLSEDHAIRFADVVGTPITIELDLPEGGTRWFNGHVARFGQRNPVGQLARYEAVVVPWLWFLTRNADCRIFQNLSVVDIVTQVFRERGFGAFEGRLNDIYKPMTYCVQYRETDFAFVSRLMESVGIAYHFEHGFDQHKLVMTDSSAGYNEVEGYESLRSSIGSRETVEYESVRSWSGDIELQPSAFAHADFDFENPRKNLETRSLSPDEQVRPDFEIFDYPGGFTDVADGEHLARVRMEEIQAASIDYRGEGDVRGLAPGFAFKFADVVRDESDQRYLCTGVTHRIESDEFESAQHAVTVGQTYECSFTAVSADQTWRPARTTPTPEIRGPQEAIVVGPDEEEIWTDEYGRIKVQFPWDRYGQANETSSAWLRVSQPSAGKRWGSFFLPRVGQEVLVEFLDADPDRPIVTGCVYDGANKPPYELPANKTISCIGTHSTKKGDGGNLILFEDKKDDEQLILFAKKDRHDRTAHDRFETVENDAHEDVKNRYHTVMQEDHLTVEQNRYVEVRQESHHTVHGARLDWVDGSFDMTANGDATITHGANSTLDVSGSRSVSANDITLDAPGGIVIKSGAASIELKNGNVKITGTNVEVTGMANAKVTGGAGIDLMAAQIKANAAMVQATGVVQCMTLISTSVVGTTYTPGAGNIM